MTAVARLFTTAVSYCVWFTHRIDEPVAADAHSWCEAPSPADHPDPWTCPVCSRVYFADRWHWREQAGMTSITPRRADCVLVDEELDAEPGRCSVCGARRDLERRALAAANELRGLITSPGFA